MHADHVETIGGNAGPRSDTVYKRSVPLTSDGFIATQGGENNDFFALVRVDLEGLNTARQQSCQQIPPTGIRPNPQVVTPPVLQTITPHQPQVIVPSGPSASGGAPTVAPYTGGPVMPWFVNAYQHVRFSNGNDINQFLGPVATDDLSRVQAIYLPDGGPGG